MASISGTVELKQALYRMIPQGSVGSSTSFKLFSMGTSVTTASSADPHLVKSYISYTTGGSIRSDLCVVLSDDRRKCGFEGVDVPTGAVSSISIFSVSSSRTVSYYAEFGSSVSIDSIKKEVSYGTLEDAATSVSAADSSVKASVVSASALSSAALIYPNTSIYASSFVGSLSGNASTATTATAIANHPIGLGINTPACALYESYASVSSNIATGQNVRDAIAYGSLGLIRSGILSASYGGTGISASSFSDMCASVSNTLKLKNGATASISLSGSTMIITLS